MSDFLLTQVINYGAPLLGVILMLGGIGIPVPGTLLVIAAGAFVRQGYLTWYTTALISIVLVVIGDNISYSIGYLAREKILLRFSHTPRWIESEKFFQKWGALSVFFTRFLVTAIAIPVNLVAGTTRFPMNRFLLFDILGEVMWIFGYGGLGYIFGSQWELVNDFISNFGGFALGIILFVIGLRQARVWQLKKQSLSN
ncbi:MAG TPA: DedA family protein [Anaerolineales bacterium]|nr:DedA family protein [Anaerolineales bacterium]HNO31488.1 DedA family protein [Anaerolineales bacterium]